MGKVVFSGQELGGGIASGVSLSHCAGDENPCRQAYIDYVGFGNSRSSWDPLTTLFAVRGASSVGCRDQTPVCPILCSKRRSGWSARQLMTYFVWDLEPPVLRQLKTHHLGE